LGVCFGFWRDVGSKYIKASHRKLKYNFSFII
jgi:hypothetical protein